MPDLQHVIIGNSAAGINCAAVIRKNDPSARITMLSAEDCMAYSPVVLPYLLSGKINEKNMYITDKSFYLQNNIELCLGTKAECIDTRKQQVILHGGSRIEYDRLLIATGASARKLSVNASSAENRIFPLRTMADAKAILAACRGTTHVLIAGAGLVGLETACALLKKGIKITIIAKSNQLLSRNADTSCAGMIQDISEKRGMDFLFGREITEIYKKNRQIRVITNLGDEFKTDMIVTGKGVKANLVPDLDSNIEAEWGIKVNTAMQTSVSNIYAAGDVAQSRHLLTGNYDMFSSWPSACTQGKTAGANMAGKNVKMAGEVAYNVMPFFNHTAAFMERKDDGDNKTRVYQFMDRHRSIYRKILVKNNRIVGAVILDAYKDTGVMLNWLKKRKNIAHLEQNLASGRALHAISFPCDRKYS